MARACDRCSRLKTQCNGDLPCNRCQRLGLDCTQTRPVLAKGRPKRDASTPRVRRPNNSHLSDSQNSSPSRLLSDASYPPPSDSSINLVRTLPEIPIPEALAAYFLDLALSPMSNFGLVEMFSREGFRDNTSVKRLKSSSFYVPSSKTLLYSLIDVGATFYSSSDPALNNNSLQQHALHSIPALYGNSRDLKIEDALSMCLLSYMGCLQASSIKVAERWAVLATVIARQTQGDEDERSKDAEIFHQKASWLIAINDGIFSLLHYRKPQDDLSRLPEIFMSPLPNVNKMSIDGVLAQSSESPKRYLNPDYFSLFLPLLRSLRFALEGQPLQTIQRENAVESLKRYFREFPQHLIVFNEIKRLYQAEAMIWFHGIFMLLHGKRDLYSCFEDRNWTSSPTFMKTAEHALLLGETIPLLIRLSTTTHQLSPATIYFLLLSAIIHAVLLRQCLNGYSETDHIPWSNLLEGASLHLFILRQIRETSSICTVDLITAVENILQAIYTSASSGRNDWEADFSVLKLYRWTGKGKGIVKINPKIADELSSLSVGGNIFLSGMSGNIAGANEAQRRDILALCDPTRRGRPGIFTYSITGVLV